MSGKYNIQMLQGETFCRELRWQNAAGSTVDIQGYTAKMQIRDATTRDLIIELSTENNRIVITTDNKIQLIIKAVDTTNLNFVNGIYDLEIYKGDDAKRIAQGTVKLNLEVTK